MLQYLHGQSLKSDHYSRSHPNDVYRRVQHTVPDILEVACRAFDAGLDLLEIVHDGHHRLHRRVVDQVNLPRVIVASSIVDL
jgi:hypothetical protein